MKIISENLKKWLLLVLLFKVIVGLVVIFTKEPILVVPLLSLFALVSLFTIVILIRENTQTGLFLTSVWIIAILLLLGIEIYTYFKHLPLFIQ